MAEQFMTPYGAAKLLQGVIPANQTVRPNWLQTFFGQTRTTDKDTVNFDVEFATKNVMGMNVAADADATPIMLPNFGHQELSFSYAKEGLNSPDYEEINTRRLGQAFGTLDVAANEVINIRSKLAIAEQRFENLHELNAANIIFTGGHVAASEKHPKVIYNFGREIKTTAAGLNSGYVPEADLTVINDNGGAGKRAWDSTGGTEAPTPVKDLITMVSTANRRSGVKAVLMSSDAYDLFEADVNANYKDAATLTIAVQTRIELHVIPQVEKYQSLNFKRSFPVGQGQNVDIYVYDAVYHTRDKGLEVKYVPKGLVACLPNAQLGIKVYGRIKHPKAKYKAMPRWINFWENAKTGKREWETHMNYVMGHTDINSLVCWQVASKT